ncbi:MAG: response regulator transcription factor, partial [Rikenellaceae bacterium]
VLLVDDDVLLGSVYVMGLQHLGFELHYLSSFVAIVAAINEFQPNILVLDVEIGDKNGIEESLTISNTFPNLPIIFISSHCEVEYIQRAIKQGGVTYLKKPFEIEELGVYIERFATTKNTLLSFGCFTYDHTTQMLHNLTTDETNKLSIKESEVLLVLIKNINVTLSRSEIEQVIGNDNITAEHIINNIISRLRKLIACDPSMQIVTIPRVGYKLSQIS